MKVNNKRILKLIIIFSVLALYIFSFSIIYNLKTIIGVGYYYGESAFETPLNGEKGGIRVRLYANHERYMYHNYGIQIIPYSTNNISINGISYLSCQIGTQSSLKYSVASNYSIFLANYVYTGTTVLYRGDNLTSQGFADITFTVNGLNETHRIYFELGVFILYSGDAINFEWNNLFIWILVIYFSLYSVPVYLIYKNIKKMKFETWYNEDLKKRDEFFLKTLSEKHKKLLKLYENDQND